MELIFSEDLQEGALALPEQGQLKQQMEQAAILAIEGEGISTQEATISVTFVSPEEIRQMNGQYRGNDAVTDVLSFPQFGDLEELPEEGELCLGDVVICTQQAVRQAEEFGHSLQRELLYLFVHSVCHLLGYDHMEEGDKRQMRAKEEAVMEQLGLSREEAGPQTDEAQEIKQLYRLAAQARQRAFAPFSHFRVGAALLAEDGRVFTGVNVESSSYGATICAERTALVKAVSEGAQRFCAIAIVCDEGAAWPCGICRQMLYEFSPTLLVITGDSEEDVKIRWLCELLPEGFRLSADTGKQQIQHPQQSKERE